MVVHSFFLNSAAMVPPQVLPTCTNRTSLAVAAAQSRSPASRGMSFWAAMPTATCVGSPMALQGQHAVQVVQTVELPREPERWSFLSKRDDSSFVAWLLCLHKLLAACQKRWLRLNLKKAVYPHEEAKYPARRRRDPEKQHHRFFFSARLSHLARSTEPTTTAPAP